MNEEMRKEFEEWADSIGLCQVDLIIDLEKYMDGNVELAWQAWKASREAMKPIKLPKTMKNTQEQSCYYYNDAVYECKEAIQQAGYKVEE